MIPRGGGSLNRPRIEKGDHTSTSPLSERFPMGCTYNPLLGDEFEPFSLQSGNVFLQPPLVVRRPLSGNSQAGGRRRRAAEDGQHAAPVSHVTVSSSRHAMLLTNIFRVFIGCTFFVLQIVSWFTYQIWQSFFNNDNFLRL